MTDDERFDHGVGPVPRQFEMVICQICGGPLLRGLPKHPDCEPRVVSRGK
jgi:hypothetical protein